MRMQQGKLTAELLRHAANTLEIIETYADDKYLPSFLLRGCSAEIVFHARIATDVPGNNIRVVTMYSPDLSEWQMEGRIRRTAR